MAEIVTVLDTETALVRTLKLKLLLPAGIVIIPTAGLATVGLLLASLTGVPPAGAGHGKATVPVTVFGPTTGFALNVNDCTPLRLTTNGASTYFPLRLAVINPLRARGELIGIVMMGKLALILPAGTVILAGGVTASRVSSNSTMVPPAGAGLLRVSVPVRFSQPLTLDALRVNLSSPINTCVSRVDVLFDVSRSVSLLLTVTVLVFVPRCVGLI